MDLLVEKPPMDLSDRSWVIHTRTEERPPVRIAAGASITDSMITDGCRISTGAEIRRSVLGPGVRVESGAKVIDSVLFTDTIVRKDAVVARTVLDKRVEIAPHVVIGSEETDKSITMVGKNSLVPAGMLVEPGAVINADVVEADYPARKIKSGRTIVKTRRLPYDL